MENKYILLAATQFAHLGLVLTSLVIAQYGLGMHIITHGCLWFFLAIGLLHIHRAGHGQPNIFSPLQQLWNKWRYVHTYGHHIATFDITHFLRHVYLSNPVPNSGKIMNASYLASMCITALFGFVLLKIQWDAYQWIYFWCNALAFAQLEESIHKRIHIKDTYLQRFEWFCLLRSIHFRHHVFPYTSNLAVLSLWLDMLHGTFSFE